MDTLTTDCPLGGCPKCGNQDVGFNYHRENYIGCSEHRTYWHIGSNVFGSWRQETEADWKANVEKYSEWERVEPIMPDPEEALRASDEVARIDKGFGVVWIDGKPRAVEPGEDPFARRGD